MNTLRYLKVLCIHKWHVYRIGRVLGVSRKQLLLHDLSKLTRVEWRGYKERFETRTTEGPHWPVAWHHHWTRNPHHWEYWAQSNHEMPAKYAKEMVADWCAAAIAYKNAAGVMSWYLSHKDRIVLTGRCRRLVEDALVMAADL